MAYKLAWLPQDALAGFTVGLTAIPQSIAYGIVAGLNPEVTSNGTIICARLLRGFSLLRDLDLFR